MATPGLPSKSKYSIVADASKCAGCMVCMLRCSFRGGDAFILADAKICIMKLVRGTHEFDITFEDDCDSCGICVKYCPYQALKRRRIKVGE